jgi:hypothetical protein
VHKAGLFPVAVGFFVAAVSSVALQTNASAWIAAKGEIAGVTPPPIEFVKCDGVVVRTIHNGHLAVRCMPGKKKACGPGEVLSETTTPDGRYSARCIPGKKKACGPGEVLSETTTPDGRYSAR